TLAGLGWIGKSALFVTRSHGSALRLTSVVTDMPLNYGEAICESQCGSCSKCVEACPGEAMAGTLWRPDVDRDFFFDVVKCRTKARALSQERLQKEITLCGKCIEVCPYTQKYINS
ncbi:MAG: epoxyqueuosine reductase, partial [Clostridia bacterium]|nr:epoxyqueuosine reductase [Clostridia bacterium]